MQRSGGGRSCEWERAQPDLRSVRGSEKKKKNSSTYFHTDVLVTVRIGAGHLSAKSNVPWKLLFSCISMAFGKLKFVVPGDPTSVSSPPAQPSM